MGILDFLFGNKSKEPDNSPVEDVETAYEREFSTDRMIVIQNRWSHYFVGKCPQCGTQAHVPDDELGVLLDCPKCDWTGYARVRRDTNT